MTDSAEYTSNSTEVKLNLDLAERFLTLHRPGGPWLLTAIIPDVKGGTDTKQFDDLAGVRSFITAHNTLGHNIYHTVNKTSGKITKKPTKAQFVLAEWVYADCDPADAETPEAAKARYLNAIDTYQHPPTLIVDSGNGIQVYWRLETPVGPGQFVWVELASKAIMESLGAKAGTQNVDRLLRVPGTINWPNATKKRNGRIACMTALLRSDPDRVLSELPQPAAPQASGWVVDDNEDIDKLKWTIRTGGNAPLGKRSEYVWYVINAMLRRGYMVPIIRATLLDRQNGISAHVYDQSNPEQYADHQIKKAREQIKLSRGEDGKPFNTTNNLCIALLKMGITLRYDQFADRIHLDGLPEFGPTLTDAAVIRIRAEIEDRFKFIPGKDKLFDTLGDVAQLNGFHPVRNYLDGLRWDGVPRLNKWLTTYCGAPDNPYTNAVGELYLIAASRRVRQPGCKFDEMLVLESPQQGKDKSTALEILAVKEEWFTDNLDLSAKGKEVIEQIRGKWFIETPELSGMKQAEVEHVKAMVSRKTDRGRMAYDRVVSEVPRQGVFAGTTNAEKYLRDTTGNRRFWPVRIKLFDLDALRRDRDQLHAEAAHREAKGESIRLHPSLWPAAAEEQQARMVDEPFTDMLRPYLEEVIYKPPTGKGVVVTDGVKITAESVWEILNLPVSQRTQAHFTRLSGAMKTIGYRRPNSSNLISVEGNKVSGYVRGEAKYPYLVSATRIGGVLSVWVVKDGDEGAV